MLLLILCNSVLYCYGQEASLMDVNGNPFVLTNSPFFDLKIVPEIRISNHPIDWQECYLEYTSGKKDTSDLKLFHKYLVEDIPTDDFNTKQIGADSLNNVTFGNDSFIVMRHFITKKKMNSTAMLVKWLGRIDSLQYVELRTQKTAPSKSFSGSSVFEFSYYAKGEQDTIWSKISISEKTPLKFEEVFSSDSLMNKFITQYGYTQPTALDVINYAKYVFAMKNGTPLWFDQYGGLAMNHASRKYKMQVIELKGSMAKVKVWSGNQLYAELSFSNVLKFEFDGLQLIYNEDGSPAFALKYREGKQINHAQISHTGDTLFTYQKDYKRSGEGKKFRVSYPLHVNGVGINALVDQSASERSYVRKYENGKLNNSYRLDGDVKVFQPVEKSVNVKQGKITRIYKKFPPNAQQWNEITKSNCINFYVLIRANHLGKLVDAQLIGNYPIVLSEYFNQLVLELNKDKGKIIAPYSVDNKMVSCEFVVPVQLYLNYPSPARYHHYDSFFMDYSQPHYVPNHSAFQY